jgi:septin family protein
MVRPNFSVLIKKYTQSGICTYSWDPIIKYIKDQHSAYLRKELTAMRDRYIQDTRIHCCLYFINPTGHALRPIDVIVMKKLSEVVNVVPVIAKSDSLTLEERERFKFKVRYLNAACLGFCSYFFRLADQGRAGFQQYSFVSL